MEVWGSINAAFNCRSFRVIVSLSIPPRPQISGGLSQQVYECAHCLRPAFTGFCGEKVGAEDTYLVFESCYRVVMSPKQCSSEGHPLYWVSCRCGQELGYFIPRNASKGCSFWFNNYFAIVGRVKARADAKKNEGRILHSFQLLKHNRPIVDGHCWLLEDVLFEEILPRLPVEYLRRLSGVCKEWRHCITADSHFISNHLHRSSESTKMSIILATNYPRHRMLFVDHRGKKSEVADVSMVVKKCGDYFFKCKVVGCCDGLVCLQLRRPVEARHEEHDAILLWNPETGQSRDAKVPPPYCVGETSNEYPVYGFGFDVSHNDYKVVKLRKAESGIKLSVFNRNTGCWRELEKGVSGCTLGYESAKSVLVCTRLYWLVVLANVSPQRLCVLWFDLNNDEFGIMDALNHPYQRFGEFRPHCLDKWNSDSLAFLQFPNDTRKELRCQIILHNTVAHNVPLFPKLFLRLHGVSWDRFYVEESKGTLVMYDFEAGVARPQQLFSSKTNCIIGDAHDYVPSLVSVYPDLTSTTQDTK